MRALYPYNWKTDGKVSVSNGGNVIVETEENGSPRGKRPMIGLEE